MDRNAFEPAIYHTWAEHFGQPDEIIAQPGTTLLPEENYRDHDICLLWTVQKHAFVKYDPEYAPVIQTALSQFPPGETLSAKTLDTLLGPKHLKSRDLTLVRYLDPDDLPEYAPPAPYNIRQLTLADAGALLALKGFLTSEEVDEGYVEVDHQIAFGCFLGPQMVAASSGYERMGFMDIGVLTHSAHRRKGLGKAVVGALCAWSSANGYIAQYRHDVTNTGSAHVAESLNFKVYAEEEAFWMK